MKYVGDIATIQQRLAATSDLYRRRLAVLDAVSPAPGEAILEIGCGGGLLLPGLAASVGPTGRVVGIDVSADQIAAAKRACQGLAVVEVDVHDARALPDPDGSFDAIVAIQVIEYLRDPAEALAELRRVAKTGSRLVILATNWDTMFFHGDAPELTTKVVSAWRRHAPHPNLPADLRPMLQRTGFRLIRQSPVTIINNAYHEDAFAYWAAQLMTAFCIGQQLVSTDEASRWLDSLDNAQRAGCFFFSSTPVLSVAVSQAPVDNSGT